MSPVPRMSPGRIPVAVRGGAVDLGLAALDLFGREAAHGNTARRRHHSTGPGSGHPGPGHMEGAHYGQYLRLLRGYAQPGASAARHPRHD